MKRGTRVTVGGREGTVDADQFNAYVWIVWDDGERVLLAAAEVTS